MLAATDTLTLRLRLLLALVGIRLAVVLFGTLALSAGGVRLEVPRTLTELPAWMLVALALAAWMLISVVWAADRIEGIGKVGVFLFLLAVLRFASITVPRLSQEVHAEVLRAIVIAFAVALTYLCIEELTGHAIKQTIFTLLPWSRPAVRHMGMHGTEIAYIEPYISNRNMAALSLALWPALMAVFTLFETARARLISAALVTVAAVTVASSQHESSALALLAGGLVLAIAFGSVRIAIGVVAAGWVAACLLVVPVTDLAFRQANLHMAEWLPRTARQRVVLWGYTASQIYQRPLTGVGVASTKTLDDARRKDLTKPPGYVYELRTGPHSHNVYLQTWYELGAIGALLFMGLGLAVLRAISRYDSATQPWLLATFTSASLIAALTWGLWQAWFMGAFAMSALLAMAVVGPMKRRV
jgi:O-antigen ligase